MIRYRINWQTDTIERVEVTGAAAGGYATWHEAHAKLNDWHARQVYDAEQLYLSAQEQWRRVMEMRETTK